MPFSSVSKRKLYLYGTVSLNKARPDHMGLGKPSVQELADPESGEPSDGPTRSSVSVVTVVRSL